MATLTTHRFASTLLAGWVAIAGCRTDPPADPPPPASTIPQDDAKQAIPEEPPTPETPAERTKRLNREADLRAGLDPDKPLAKWDLSAMSAEPKASVPCTSGTAGQLQIEVAGKPPQTATHAELAAGPAAWTPAIGRLETRLVVRVSALVSGGTGPLTAVSCTGETIEIPGDQLNAADRWVLVLNQRQELKLVDLVSSPGGKAPAARHVTVLRR